MQTPKIEDIVSRIKLELCRMEVKYNAGFYDPMVAEYCAMKQILQDRLRELEKTTAIA